MTNITNRRIRIMADAIEIGVDEDEFRFDQPAERELWHALHDELEPRLARQDRVWLAA